MGDVVFTRAERPEAPTVPTGELTLQAPPGLPRPTPRPLIQILLPVILVVAVLGMVVVMMRTGMMRNPMFMLFPVMMAVSAVGMLAGTLSGGNKTAETDELRKDYLRYLGQTRDTVRETASAQRAAALWRHPDPVELPALVGTPRMWERDERDPEYLTVRVGPGRQSLATRLSVPDTGPVDDLEPVSVVSMRRFVRVHSVVDDLPVALELRAFPAISLEGEVDEVRSGVRAMLAGLVVSHGPDQVRVAVAASEGHARRAWEWLKWLPHHQHPTFTDGGGRVRLTEFSLAGVESMIASDIAERHAFSPSAPIRPGVPHLVVVVDGVGVTGAERLLAEDGLDGVTVVEVSGSRAGQLRDLALRRGLCIRVDDDGRALVRTESGDEEIARLDAMSPPEAERLAMALARFRPADTVTDADGSTSTRRAPGLPDLLGIGLATQVDPAVAWRRRGERDRLRVPVGVTPDGAPVELDLKEAAQGGMGPHGLCIGATGSGKSEFLRTLVLGLVATHDPDALNLVLVDFKGGATFLGLESLAHVAAVITNLQAEITMVDRMRDALEGELTRRQEVLRAAGNYAGVGEYEAARAKGAPLDPMPALVIVVDEFSELLSSKPEFAELFLTIGRLGRSLHVHLLLASQRLEEGRLRGLDSHLSYRIALKTFSATESRTVLGVTDAYHLPATPGAGYLKIDAGDPVRFDAAYVSGPYLQDRRLDGSSVVIPVARAAVRPFSAWYMPVPALAPALRDHHPGDPAGDAADAAAAEPDGDRNESTSLLDVLVGRLAGHGRPAHEVWLPPLGAGAPLDAAVGTEPSGARDNRPPTWRFPLAVIDLPFEQRRDIWHVDLSGADGNIAVVGGTRSGKSTTLSTLILSAAATIEPDRLSIYVVDLGGGALQSVAGLPHVGGVARRGEEERIRRTVAEVGTELKRRETAFREAGVTSVDQARRRLTELDGRRVAEYPDVLLVIDGWQAFRTDFEDLEQLVVTMVADGLSYGVHVALSAARWADLRPALRDALGTRVELRLGDPTDSMIDRRVAMTVPSEPGRGLSSGRHHMLVYQPRLDGLVETEGIAAATASAARHLAQRWRARVGDIGAGPVRMLPEVLPYAQLASLSRPGSDGSRTRVPLGVDEADLTVVYADLASDPLMLVLGDSECGKTSVLRSVTRGLVSGNTPEKARVIVVDYRRTMLGEVRGDHLAGYAATETALVPMVEHLVRILDDRMPGADVTPDELRARSWWSGPRIHLIVDDLDLVITGSGNPLLPLARFLPHARDIGLSVVLARRSAGASRALYDAFVGRIRDLGGAGLIMSGSREEGPLLGGVRPAPQPAGRGRLVTRDAGVRLVQTTWSQP
ncbi:type VII secretion protein EccCa [Rhodococcus sp. IEGM 1408]|uniref:type VII secretion protein EccCa n=1 Tax=Rhodococcus sp. IEGM 1408 TaxID=3082220 RepID=UPI002954931F|nr:type VII secretion protein EccCa [Rhodococcus sp. IEGM 1408]MDV8001195.1 type VII secretion protein EccCa [Rhodococcus sp. IEGM 1408]